MPLYIYKHKQTGETAEVFQRMNDVHEYNGPNNDEYGLWERVFVAPHSSIDTKVDPFDKGKFVASTVGKKDTYGDLFERSREASEKRTEILGKDPVKEQYYEDYSKSRGGAIHPDVQKRNIKKRLGKKGVDIDF
jgi:hypothetical protein